jgi:hypothetical protein
MRIRSIGWRGAAIALVVAGAAFASAGCSASCEEGDKTYEDGEEWMCSDGCNFCSCNDGEITSTAMGCPGE